MNCTDLDDFNSTITGSGEALIDEEVDAEEVDEDGLLPAGSGGFTTYVLDSYRPPPKKSFSGPSEFKAIGHLKDESPVPMNSIQDFFCFQKDNKDDEFLFFDEPADTLSRKQCAIM
mmetsp:Transcript_10622/g.13789  ORF Transcript_10622/g.13789 Transcript_10622/m.13789 type:complete len:116 (+) Transcript_10622:178-525(+)|eukprot:CAMPEP_0117749726 /NCGR_PEP_ID=MMETSP0947-20121206/9898_1 /TAXON_ID=44440 /ORGANISM="Chattonella subsalsa, Strain CCMP2191" /LENGTH=115 /DNA_ID=CAMNT_0005567665 /DNA_START=159 /DNA_END=506 /DNA_ORIENTATION=+